MNTRKALAHIRSLISSADLDHVRQGLEMVEALNDPEIDRCMKACVRFHPNRNVLERGVELRNRRVRHHPAEVVSWSLKRYRHLDGVKTVRFSGCPVANLDFLVGNDRLELLNLSGNARAVTDLSPLVGLPLHKLLLGSLPAVTDLSPVGTLTGLKWLSVEGSGTGDLSALANLTALETLFVGNYDRVDAQVGDISFLAPLTQLISLHLSGLAQVSDLSVLSSLSKLAQLRLSRLPLVPDLSALTELMALELLHIDDVGISDLRALDDLHRIRSFSVSRCTGISPDELRRNAASRMRISSNAISSVSADRSGTRGRRLRRSCASF
ncbi:MAG: hypothetical protein AAFV53_38995, partial [Myxococcota bacterium]